jgi:predicted lipoprotein
MGAYVVNATLMAFEVCLEIESSRAQSAFEAASMFAPDVVALNQWSAIAYTHWELLTSIAQSWQNTKNTPSRPLL